MIPSASALDPVCARTLAELSLPHLAQLLGLLQSTGAPVGSDENSLNTPFEQALAVQRQCPSAAGDLPTASWTAQSLGLDERLAWALLTPLHLTVGSDQITALAPAALGLDERESRAFFASLAELWPAAEGWQAHWVAPCQWLLAHPSFAQTSSASLERVLLRNIEAWMPEARSLRRLQNEVQMLLHHSPLNQAREASGKLPLNSVWISGCGVAQGADLAASAPDLLIDDRLSAPLANGDWAAWAEAWQRLDSEAIAPLLARIKAGQAGQLTLCGERLAQTYQMPARSPLRRLWQGLLPPRAAIAKVLEAL